LAILEAPGRDWTEGQFQAWVVAQARAAGWRVHVTLKRLRKASLVADPDWPDLEMVKGGRFIFAELKSAVGKPSAGQVQVLLMLNQTKNEVFLWAPQDWRDVMEVLNR
jgi:hypothetical protein